MAQHPDTDATADVRERAIRECVRLFYERGRADPLLGPVFDRTVGDWGHHLQVITDFWSDVLLDSDRYHGRPYPLHAHLPVRPEHFTRWIELFERTAAEALPPDQARVALAKARHMSRCFQAGMFPAGLTGGTS